MYYRTKKESYSATMETRKMQIALTQLQSYRDFMT